MAAGAEQLPAAGREAVTHCCPVMSRNETFGEVHSCHDIEETVR